MNPTSIEALMSHLPVSGLNPGVLAVISLGGLDQFACPSIELLEPPARCKEAFIDPVACLVSLAIQRHMSEPAAQEFARQLVGEVFRREGVAHQVHSYLDTFYEHTRHYIPARLFARLFIDLQNPVTVALQALLTQLVDPALLADLGRLCRSLPTLCDEIELQPVFRGPSWWGESRSLLDLPFQPLPQAMIEYMPGPPWHYDISSDQFSTDCLPLFNGWRESMQVISRQIEDEVGEPCYYFANPDDHEDDDLVHRFLVLHWCCTWRPEADFVKFLVRVSRAGDLDNLKAALIDPDNYRLFPHRMNNALLNIEAHFSRYLFDELK